MQRETVLRSYWLSLTDTNYQPFLSNYKPESRAMYGRGFFCVDYAGDHKGKQVSEWTNAMGEIIMGVLGMSWLEQFVARGLVLR